MSYEVWRGMGGRREGSDTMSDGITYCDDLWPNVSEGGPALRSLSHSWDSSGDTLSCVLRLCGSVGMSSD